MIQIDRLNSHDWQSLESNPDQMLTEIEEILEMEKSEDLLRERTRGGELFADEIAGGDVRDSEEVAEPAGVGAFTNAGDAEEDPLHVPLLRISAREASVQAERRRRRSERIKLRCGYGRRVGAS